MAYISTEEVKEIRNKIKEAFKGTGFKFSVKQRHHSSLYVTVKEGPIDFNIDKHCESVNKHWYKEHFQCEQQEFFTKLFGIVNEAKPQHEISYDNDYGSWPNYYQNYSIGEWDKPYKFTGQKEYNHAECIEALLQLGA